MFVHNVTLAVLIDNEKDVQEIRQVIIANGTRWCTWEEFATCAEATHETGMFIDDDLLIIGPDWWLERCDGEWAFCRRKIMCKHDFDLLSENDHIIPTHSILTCNIVLDSTQL